MNIFKYTLLLGFLFFSISCDEMEEMNLNPNEPTAVTPDVLLPSAIRNSVTTLTNESFLIGNNAAQLTAKALRTEVDSYNWNAFPTVWEGLYGSLTDISVVEGIASDPNNQNEALEGAAITLKSWIFSVLTNAYGDIPYFNAIKGSEDNFTPAYDPQREIYEDLLSELDRAATLLASGSGSIGGDILFDGDPFLWLKFANSLRLRLLMTANNQISNAGTQFSQIVSTGNIIGSNADNAALSFLTTFPNQFPTVPLKTGDFDAVVLSNTSLNVMQSYADPRLARYARPDGDDYTVDPATLVNDFSGIENGFADGSLCDRVGGSRLGSQYFTDPEETLIGAPDLGVPEGLILTYAEVEFLLAEAAAKGWISDDIETHYQNGIQASMDYYQVDYSQFNWTDFSDFYTNSGVAYNEVTDIWEQKWLSLFFVGLEPYFEVRRWYFESGMNFNGIPFLNPSCANLNNDNLPLRFLYPGEEQSLNQANYLEAVSGFPNGVDDINATTWLVQ